MSNFNVSESIVYGIFESDLRFRIDSIQGVLFGDVPMDIVNSISIRSPRYHRLMFLRDLLYAKLRAYRNSLSLFRDACSISDCCYATI